MNSVGLIVGIVLAIAGALVLGAGVIFSEEIVGKVVALFYGAIMLGVGIYMIFNHQKEDRIEQITLRDERR